MITPPPPNYPPTAGAYQPAPPPQIIVVTPEAPKTNRPGLLTGLRPVYNLTALAVALAPIFDGYSLATGLGTAVHQAATDGYGAGAWTMAVAALALTTYLDRTRRDWLRRLWLAASLLGTALSLPVLDAVLLVLTGTHR